MSCDEYQERERSRRAATGSERIRIYSRVQPVPKRCSKFMANGENKKNLIAFLFEEWKNGPAVLFQGVNVFLALGSLRAGVTCSEVDVGPISSLHCDHKEAADRLCFCMPNMLLTMLPLL